VIKYFDLYIELLFEIGKFEGKIAKWIRIVGYPTRNRKWLTSVTSVLYTFVEKSDFLRLFFP
jgi:uncharacterized protein with PIN domain